MIEDGNTDKRAYLDQAPGHGEILWAGLHVGGWMIVSENDPRCAGHYRCFKNFSGMNQARRERSDGDGFNGDRDVSGGNMNHPKVFSIEPMGLVRQELVGIRRALDRRRYAGSFPVSDDDDTDLSHSNEIYERTLRSRQRVANPVGGLISTSRQTSPDHRSNGFVEVFPGSLGDHPHEIFSTPPIEIAITRSALRFVSPVRSAG